MKRALVVLAACGSQSAPPPPRSAPPDAQVIPMPAPTRRPSIYEAAGVDPSSTIVQEALALGRDAGAGPDAAPPPVLGPSDLTVTVNGVTRRFTYGQANLDGSTLEIQLTDAPRTCKDWISQSEDAHLIFHVEGGPGNRFHVGEDISVSVGAEIPDEYRIAMADPVNVRLHFDRVPRKVGKRIEATLDVADPDGRGVSAHGRIAVPLCSSYR